MSCCGKMRTTLRQTVSSFPMQTAAPRPPVSRFRSPMGVIYFEYVGATAITALGAATGRQYRFTSPGVPVAVDARDRVSMAKVPNLREIQRKELLSQS